MVVFASLLFYTKSYAQVILYESYELGGGINYTFPGGGNNSMLIGTFEVPYPLFYDSSGWLGVGIIPTSYGNAGGITFGIASTTSSYTGNGDMIWTFDEVQQVDLTVGVPNFKDITQDSGGGVWLLPGHTYGIYAIPSSSSHVFEIESDTFDLIYYGYLSWDGEYASIFADNAGLTRIVSVVPTLNEVIATSTSAQLSANIYINTLDYKDEMFLRFRYIRNQDLQAQVANTDVLWTEIDEDITQDESSTISTNTSILETGIYTYQVQMRVPSVINQALTWFNLGNIYDPGLIAYRYGQFTVVEPTALDQYIIDMASTTTALLNDPGVFEDIQDNCNPISGFDALACITALIVPNNQQINAVFDTLQEYVLTKAPVGYVTRLVAIMGEEATTTLPMATITLGDSSFLGETSYSVDLGGIIADAGDILEGFSTDSGVIDAPHETMWDLVNPIVELIVYLGLFLIIIRDVTGLYKKRT